MPSVMKTLVVTAGLVLAVGLTGCSSAPDSISGADLGKAVNKELLAKAKPVSSTMVCPKIKFAKGAKVTCTQTEVIDAGRQLEVPVTVTLTKVDTDTGKYAYDFKQADKPTKYGLTGDFIENDLKTQWDQQKGGKATVTCPDYLPGTVGASVTCKLTDSATAHTIKVTVDKVDEANFDTNYTFAEV
ncbi:MAG: hypothetical protein JWO46_862 [Nocardioidaceae bacterium]|nr:hypothetical protein [Nocardioidaceae bacterium]